MKQRQKSSGSSSADTTATAGYQPTSPNNNNNNSSSNNNNSFLSWVFSERESLSFIMVCAALGMFLGFAIGAGWLTRGAGSYQYTRLANRVLGAMSNKTGFVRKRSMKHFVVSAWRANLAKRIRSTLIYQLLTFRKAARERFFVDIFALLFWNNRDSPMWPPNWILFRDVDLTSIDIGQGGLSPIMVSSLSFILPWRKSLINRLARNDRAKVNLRDLNGNIIGSSEQILPIKSNQPINPYYHPMAFHTLREYIIRFDDGFVHPDLGFLVPAPSGKFVFVPASICSLYNTTNPLCSGAERGLGMVRDTYTKCQVHCNPGTAEEKLKQRMETIQLSEESHLQAQIDAEILKELMDEIPGLEATTAETVSSSSAATKISPQVTKQSINKKDKVPDPLKNTTTYEGIQAAVQMQHQSTPANSEYTQSEVLLHIPLEAQVTRKMALEILLGLLSPDQNGRAIEELDDAFILAVYLAHERGLGINSRIWPYIATLPTSPTCALHWGWQQSVVDVLTAMSVEMGTDVQGWPNEISKAADMSEKIVLTLSRAFGETLAKRSNVPDVTTNIRWALCQVASRAVAGREEYGSLRLVPMMDMINHDLAADKFTEVTGKEKMEDGHFLDADENQAGSFIVRSQRHGERKRLKKGQELMANYNVPSYSPLDWFLNMGYIPPERAGKWTMLEAGLPRNYRGAGFSRKSSNNVDSSGAFGSGKPEIQVIRQHTQQQQPQQQQTCQQPQQQQQTCQR